MIIGNLDSEFVDIEKFILDNEEIIQSLFEQSESLIDKDDNESNEDWIEQVCVITTCCLINGIEKIENKDEIDITSVDDNILLNACSQITAYYYCLDLERKFNLKRYPNELRWMPLGE